MYIISRRDLCDIEEGGIKGVWARKNVKWNWISRTKNNFYPYTEYICQCARNMVNNGHERRKHVKKKGKHVERK